MRALIGLISVVYVAASLVAAAIPHIPISKEPFGKYGWQGYPWPKETRVRSTAETAKILSENKATPLQTMLLLYQTTDNGKIFDVFTPGHFEYLNEYPQYDADLECYQEEVNEKALLCIFLQTSDDGSLLYRNLNDLCTDLEAKITAFCADKIKPLF